MRLIALLNLTSQSPQSSLANSMVNKLVESFMNLLVQGANAPAQQIEASNIALLNSLALPVFQQLLILAPAAGPTMNTSASGWN